MRFERIHLTRYGHFTDYSIDLGTHASDGDFHIIYGPNEAGKSTLRDACIDFLYGIPARTKYGFMHDYSVMMVGARITAAGTCYEAKRTKGRKNTLMGAGDTPLSETTLKAILGGITRDGYEHMYAINDDSLDAGGESILNSEGDLGSLLFGAMSGLPDISSALAKAKEQTEAFYKPSARSTHLNQLKFELKNLDQEINDNDVDAGKYARLKADARQAERQWQEKKTELDEKRTEQRQLKALIDAHPIWQEYLRVEKNLKPLSDAPDVPEAWADEVNQLLSRNAEVCSKAETETKAVKRAQQELDSIECDDTGLSLMEQVKRLQQDDLEARYKTSFDIEQFRAERRRSHEKIEGYLRALGQPLDTDPKTLILPVASKTEINSLLAKISTIEADLKAASKEWQNANDELEAVKQELAELEVPVKEPVDIKAALELTKEAPKPEELESLTNVVEQVRKECDDAITNLSPWLGNATTLSILKLPDPERVQRLQSRDNRLSEASQGLADEKQRHQDNLAQQISTIDSLVQEAKVIADEAVESARQARDEAWALHRDSLNQTILPSAALLQQSADAFANALSAYEQLLLNRFNQSTEVAQLRAAKVERANTQAKLGRLEEKQKELSTELYAHAQELETLFDNLLLPADFNLSNLNLWLERYKQVVKAADNLKAAKTDQQTRKEKYQHDRKILEEALLSHGLTLENKTWPQLLQLGREMIDAWDKVQQEKMVLEKSCTKAAREESKRQRELNKFEQEKAEWFNTWSTVLNATWLGEQTPQVIEAMLSTIDSLIVEAKENSQLDDKISALSDDRKRYCVEVQRLAQIAGEQYDETDPLITADLLRDRINRAEQAHRSKEKAARDFTEAQKRLAIQIEHQETINRRFEELRQKIPADNLEALRGKITQGIERSRLRTRLLELERDINRQLNQDNIENSLALLNEKVGTPESLDETKTHCESLSSDLTNIEDQVSVLYSEWQELKKQLDTLGADGTAAKLVEQREALLLDIEAEAHRFIRLSTGIMLANEALHTYRETHRSSMMEAANDAFTRITRGGFKGLETATQDGRELLFGKRVDGSTILASEMSRGTRFQLYLALRIAGHAELARNGETLPFFADDILEPFDDDRSIETFALLNEMAKHGQVVYLTHHQHLCELAKNVTGKEVRVHELPGKLTKFPEHHY